MDGSPATLLEKLWSQHVVARRADGASLLYIDRHLVHDGARNAFESLEAAGRPLRAPGQTFAFADHLVPSTDRAGGLQSITLPDAREMVEYQTRCAARYGIPLFGLGDPRQGIVHVAAPEQGITLPGLTIVCGDSHTSTHGAFGTLAFGIGTTEVVHVLATQALWQRPPRSMQVHFTGTLPPGVTSKDLVLHLIGRIGAGGGVGHAIEYTGPVISRLDMEQRMTLCNMSIEAGARAGMVAPDDTTYQYLSGRPYAPRGADWDRALRYWRSLPTDPGARYERRVEIDVGALVPEVTWGTSPQDVVPITGVVPDPRQARGHDERARQERALRYMDLRPGTPMTSIAVDHVFIGSCTNARLGDLREVARIVKGRRVVVPTMVVPGSGEVRAQAEREGLARVLIDAGLEWREPGCSMCLGMNGDMLRSGQRCASTSNRNFEGRQGRGVRTHLMSPAMAAATAVTGRLTDPRTITTGGDR